MTALSWVFRQASCLQESMLQLNAVHSLTLCLWAARHTSAVAPAPEPRPFCKLGAFVTGVGPPPDPGQLANYIQRLRGYGFDATPIIRKFLSCGAPFTEDLVCYTYNSTALT